MNEPLAAPPIIPEHKDRTAGLRVFGVLLLLAGIFCALLVPLMAFAQIMAARAGVGPTDARMMLASVFFYVVLAAVFIWLGIGSLRARRWARALILVLAWGWLAAGVLGLAALIALLPQLTQAFQLQGGNVPPGLGAALMAFLLAFLTLVYLLVPGTLVLFYRSRHVKATCEARSPTPSWTDACPLPVLGLSAWVGFSALMMLMLPVAYNGVFPLFGRFVSGWPGALLGFAVAAALAYAAWAAYRLKSSGWWTVFILLLLGGISNTLTLLRADLGEMYRLMGYSDAIIAQVQHYNFHGPTFAWLCLAWLVPLAAYLFYVRKFFHQRIITQELL